MNDRIVNIKTEQIPPHPENPRKDCGDLSEMAALIGRRLAAVLLGFLWAAAVLFALMYLVSTGFAM